ncbi:DNA-binding protein YbiB [Lonsdalea populi]|uniref:DNA-binding protein YbiB n=1 Tax=Lonsdalea populi TaxID=1172565 RepID=A0A3N0U9I3_9GAMM|nr:MULTISPECIES: DNA-binding protein YbiB [Lonsdalea]RAT14400.1 DNA-binding protein YbiB [Lonsdalea quercina]RAT26578.1 DNA-binding protein YbiB [Lonsdalea populi]RAT35084.1 DNA-binding protein YbiB [Lonsdalea populi]RAT42779.1 DNA-binding protein YbiB [Lonsdalea populi]RAT49788.1 DNA-binding protein YbiB [Lonsdalea populi]
MDYTNIIKEVGRGKNHARDLDQETARSLYEAMLNDAVPELELGGLLIAFRIKGEAEAEMRGFYQAMAAQTLSLMPPLGRPLPIVIPTYNGARRQANLTPLLALLLHKLGLPVVVHGVKTDPTRVTTCSILQEMGMAPVESRDAAQRQLDRGELVFLPIDVLCPPMARQLNLRWRMGVRNSAHTLVKVATPFASSGALRLASVSHPEYIARVGTFFEEIDGRALLMPGTEGEVYANPRSFPETYFIYRQQRHLLQARQDMIIERTALPASSDAVATAQWTTACLRGEQPVPQAIIMQLACCLVGCGEADSLAQGINEVVRRLAV